MANRKKPVQLKALAGTKRKDRDGVDPEGSVDFDILDEVPEPPGWLPNDEAIDEWNRLAPILQRNKLLTDATLGQLGQLCALHGKIVQGYKAGAIPSASTISTLRCLANDFGLTPVAAEKIGKPAGAQKGNKFQNNKRGASSG